MSWAEAFHAVLGDSQKDMLWWQMCLRAVLVFVFGLVLVRFFARRAFGEQTPLDIVLAIVIGSNMSRAVTGNAPFFPTLAATVVMVVVFWISGHCAARWHWFSWLTKGSPIRLARDGELDELRMKRMGVSAGDVMEAARSAGIADLAGIRDAFLERNGKISLTRREAERDG